MWIANRWLNCRTQVLCAAMSGLVALAVVLKGHVIGSTLSGLVLLYTIDFSDYLTFLTRMHAECQMSMNSVERIIEYCAIEQEQYHPTTRSRSASSVGDDDGSGGASPHGSPRGPRGGDSPRGSPRDGASPLGDSSSGPRDRVSGAPGRPTTALDFYGDSAATLKGWPAVGSIEFVNISMKYRPTSPPVLK